MTLSKCLCKQALFPDAVQAEKHFQSMIGSLQSSLRIESTDVADELELFSQLATNALRYLEACKNDQNCEFRCMSIDTEVVHGYVN